MLKVKSSKILGCLAAVIFVAFVSLTPVRAANNDLTFSAETTVTISGLGINLIIGSGSFLASSTVNTGNLVLGMETSSYAFIKSANKYTLNNTVSAVTQCADGYTYISYTSPSTQAVTVTPNATTPSCYGGSGGGGFTPTPVATATQAVATSSSQAEPVSAPVPSVPETPAPAAVVETPARISVSKFIKRLVFGSKNDEVKGLQEFLAKYSDIYPEGTVSGYFGSLTRKAVQRFQEKYNIAKQGIPGYGEVGPATRAKLNKLLNVNGSTPAPQTQNQPAAADNALIQTLQDQLKALQVKLTELLAEQVKQLQSQLPQ